MAKEHVENSTQSQHKGSQSLNRSKKMYKMKVKPWEGVGGVEGGKRNNISKSSKRKKLNIFIWKKIFFKNTCTENPNGTI